MHSMMWLRDTIRRKQDQNFCFSDGMSLEIFRENNKKRCLLWSNSRYFCPFFRPNDHPICCSDCVTRRRPAKILSRSKYLSRCRFGMGVFGSVLLMFYLFGLQLVGKSKLGSLFLELGKLVFVFGHLLEGGLDELALHVTDGDGELVDLKVTEDNFTLEEEHLSLK